MAAATEPFALGDWLIEPSLNCMSAGTRSVRLRPQVMEVLVYLASRDGKVATLESIHDDLWAGKVVSSGTIYNCIAELRHAFASSGSGLEYIETLPKKGYRLAPHILTRPAAKSDGATPVSIAILPLANRGAMDTIDYLRVGISDEILHGLSKVDGLRVYSARALKDEQLDARVVGLRYGADLVLGGSLQMQDRRLRAMFRLEKVLDGQVVWSDRVEQEAIDLFDLQERVALRVVDAVAPMLSGKSAARPAPRGSGTRNLEALKAFLLGRHTLSRMTPSGHDEAIRHFERAVELDPTFARAHYRLYLALYMRHRYFGGDGGSLDPARMAVTRAREHGYRPAVPWVHIHRRLHPEARLSSRELALEAIEKIRNADPEWSSFAYEQLGWVLADAGLFTGTLAFTRKVLASPDHNFEDSDVDEEVPNYAAASGDLEEAIALWSGLIQKDTARPLFRCERSILYARTGQYRYAGMDIDAIGHRGFQALSKAFLAYYEGRREDVRPHHEQLMALRARHPLMTPFTCFLVGDFNRGMEFYEQAVSEDGWAFVDFGVARASMRARLPASLVQEIESHPRFARLMASQGIDDAWCNELVRRVNDISPQTGIVVSL